MRRKLGTLMEIERDLLEVAVDLMARGEREFYGFSIAKELRARRGENFLAGYGTLYRALNRLARAGFLVQRWEDATLAEMAGRPRRKLYRLMAAGRRALAEALVMPSPSRTKMRLAEARP